MRLIPASVYYVTNFVKNIEKESPGDYLKSVKNEENNYKTRLTLLQRLTTGQDEQSWMEFSDIYRGYLYAICRNMEVPAHEIEDIIQDVLLSVWKSLPGFTYDPEKGRFSGWLSRVTANRVKSLRLSDVRRKNRELKSHNDQDSDDPEIYDKFEKSWIEFITEKAWENIKNKLSDKMRNVFEMYMEGRKIKEIAESLDFNENTVSVYKKRVATALRKEIQRLEAELN